MSNRDELATTIMHHPWLPDHKGLYTGLCPECPGRKIAGGHNSPSHAGHLADAILAAGYRKPRTITSLEELDALPFEAVLRDFDGHVLERWGQPEENLWATVMVNAYIPRRDISLPATVLFDPEAAL